MIPAADFVPGSAKSEAESAELASALELLEAFTIHAYVRRGAASAAGKTLIAKSNGPAAGWSFSLDAAVREHREGVPEPTNEELAMAG